MNYKYARYIGFKHHGKYWIKYTDDRVEAGNRPGIRANGYSFAIGESINPWLSNGFFPFDSNMKFFQEIKYKNLPKELKGTL